MARKLEPATNPRAAFPFMIVFGFVACRAAAAHNQARALHDTFHSEGGKPSSTVTYNEQWLWSAVRSHYFPEELRNRSSKSLSHSASFTYLAVGDNSGGNSTHDADKMIHSEPTDTFFASNSVNIPVNHSTESVLQERIPTVLFHSSPTKSSSPVNQPSTHGTGTDQTTVKFRDDELEVRYISKTKVVVQIPGTKLNQPNPDGEGYTDRWATVGVPPNHTVFISLAHFHSTQARCMHRTLEVWTRSETNLTDFLCHQSDDDADSVFLPRAIKARELKVHFMTIYHEATIPFILALSFHKSSVPPLQRLPSGLWNCSVSHWPDFDFHFRCNLVTECAGGEDEMNCPFTGHCGQGLLTVDNHCYQYIEREEKLTWFEAQFDCARRDGYLASLNTKEEWDSIFSIMDRRPRRLPWYLGLQDSPTNPHNYYMGTFRWADQSTAIYERASNSPVGTFVACGHQNSYRHNTVDVRSFCVRPITNSYLCEFDNTKPGTHNGEKKWQMQVQSPSTIDLPLPYTVCPDRHSTLQLLACDPFSACWWSNDPIRADAINDITGGPSRASCPAPLTSLPPVFTCRTGQIGIAYSLVCDGRTDCVNNSDENFCHFPPCSDEAPVKCAASGQCIALRLICDGQKDCHDGSDETDCQDSYPLMEFRTEWPEIVSPAIINFNASQWVQDLPAESIDYDVSCPETHFQCADKGYCLPVYVLCNGVNDCPGREDEVDCMKYTCPGLYRCRGSSVCLHATHVCDGLYQCPQKDDELFCDLHCPPNCTCYGFAFTCGHAFHADRYRDVRYLDARGSEMSPWQLVNNTLLVFLSLANCRIRHLQNLTFVNLHIFDISHNLLRHITVSQLSQMRNLKILVLAGNPLTSNHVFQDGSTLFPLKMLTDLDLAETEVKEVNSVMLNSFPNLQTLNLSHSGVVHIGDKSLQSVSKLHLLDLRGCPVTQFPDDIFQNLQELQTLFAGNYKLCCSAVLPKGFNPRNCQAPFDEVSSCQALLQSDIYRMLLSVFAAFSLLGNLFSFLARMLWFKNSGKSGFAVFVTHLSISDFLMGVYLAIVGVADRLYLGSYLWEDITWRHSVACKLVGFLSLLSCEVSAVVVCLITFDRFLALRFPFSRFRFRPGSAMVVTVFTWFGCGMLAAAPLLGKNAHWHFYSQTGICIPLPITRSDFAGHSYAFGLMIIFNFILFLLIASGQVSIYLSILANSMSVADTTRKSRDVKIARRLITITVSDFLCWFPIGLLGLLASQGVPIPGEVNVAMAIIVMPLNSALNPFLYNLNVVLEKRKRVREETLLAAIKNEILKV